MEKLCDGGRLKKDDKMKSALKMILECDLEHWLSVVGLFYNYQLKEENIDKVNLLFVL
jgi:hypothetical protein